MQTLWMDTSSSSFEILALTLRRKRNLLSDERSTKTMFFFQLKVNLNGELVYIVCVSVLAFVTFRCIFDRTVTNFKIISFL